MKLGIISDIHDNVWRLAEAVPYLKKTGGVLHCGDLIAPFMVQRLKEGVGDVPVHFVWGNNDGDKKQIFEMANKYTGFNIYNEFADIRINGLRIAINHYSEIAKGLAQSQEYDLVCFGHNHIASEEKVGKTLLLNPGEVMGLNGRSTIVLFDTATCTVEWVELWKENA